MNGLMGLLLGRSAGICGICAREYFLQIDVSFRGIPRIGTTRNPLVIPSSKPKSLQEGGHNIVWRQELVRATGVALYCWG